MNSLSTEPSCVSDFEKSTACYFPFMIYVELEMRAKLFELCQACSSVVAFHMTALLKRRLVQLVKEYMPKRPVIMAVGDGVNDVPMIQVPFSVLWYKKPVLQH